MSNKTNLIEYLSRNGKGIESWDEIGAKFGYSGEAARSIWRKVRKKDENKISAPDKGKSSFQEDFTTGKAEISKDLNREVHNLEELIQFCEIDTLIWDVERYVQNFWGNADNPHWQVKAWLKRKKTDELDKLSEVLYNYKSNYIPLSKKDILINDSFVKPVSVFISLADPHIDKKTLDGTSIDDKTSKYLEVLKALVYRAYKSHYIDEIIYVLGNDYFTSDNYFPGTTKVTPQFVTDEYDVSYDKGFDLAVTAINHLKQFCNKLKVIHVPANHDRTKSFYMLHGLQVYFRADENIVFDRTADNTKMHVYGNTSIGMHHGDTIMEKMPLYFASKFRQAWGNTKYTEIALADKHHKKEWKFSLAALEDMGTRMFISPSLTSPDVYHKDHNYDLAILAGTVRIYDKEKGFIGELEERI